MQLTGKGNTALSFRISVEGCLLMRIFTVAEILQFGIRLAVYVRHLSFIPSYLTGQIIGNGTVIQSGMKECLAGKVKTEFFRKGICLNPFQNFIILFWIHYYGYILIVLCCSANHGRAAYIDILNRFRQSYIRTGNGFTEWIQIDCHQINTRDSMFLHSLYMFRIVPDSQNAAMNLRVQCLDTSIHHFRETCHLRYRNNRNAGCCDSLQSTSGRNDFYAQFMKSLCKFHNTRFIRNTD